MGCFCGIYDMVKRTNAGERREKMEGNVGRNGDANVGAGFHAHKKRRQPKSCLCYTLHKSKQQSELANLLVTGIRL